MDISHLSVKDVSARTSEIALDGYYPLPFSPDHFSELPTKNMQPNLKSGPGACSDFPLITTSLYRIEVIVYAYAIHKRSDEHSHTSIYYTIIF